MASDSSPYTAEEIAAIKDGAVEDEMRKYTLADLREGMHDLLAKGN